MLQQSHVCLLHGQGECEALSNAVACGPPLEQAGLTEAPALAWHHPPRTSGLTAALVAGGTRAGAVRLKK